MKPKNAIVWILLLGIVVLLMSTSVQAKELTEVNANDILEKIENGENIYLENVRITDKIDLNKIELETVPRALSEQQIELLGLEEELKIVESEITIKDSIFENDINFSNTLFRKFITFNKTTFSGQTNFEGAIFSERVSFESANFNDAVNFVWTVFISDSIFREAIFSYDANFNYAIFIGDAEFSFARFDCAKFWEVAIFVGTIFSGNATFINASFNTNTFFTGATFKGDADFSFACFRDYATFSDTKFNGKAFFSFTRFDRVHFINATFTEFYLLDADYNQMLVCWESLEKTLAFYGPTYIKLIKNFRETENFKDADDAYYQYRRLSQKYKKLSFSKLMDVVAWGSCGYGVKPGRPLIWAFVLIMVFTLVYWLGDGIRRLKENDGDNNRMSRWAAFYNAFYFSVVTFTTVGYGDWYPEDRYRIVVMIEGVLGWLLLALFIVTLANVMIRP